MSVKRKSEHLSEYVNITHDNSIFEDIKYKLTPYQKEQLDDFIDIFYYLIINYSKNCYKYNPDLVMKTNSWSAKKFIPNFDYSGANKHSSHSDLLEIQKQMFEYRKQYKKYPEPKQNIFTKDFTDQIINFINESLHIFYVSVINPIRYINPNIMTKLKYHNEKYLGTPKKSDKINYERLKELIESGILRADDNIL